MASTRVITNDEGEILGIETVYDDEPSDYEDDAYGYDDYYEDEPFRSEQESDLQYEWS